MDERKIDVTVARRVSHRPWWAPLAGAAERVVRAVPVHRDTKSGRRNALQVRTLLLFVGIVAIVFWRSALAPLGFIPCILALFVPLSETRRRTTAARLRAAQNGASRVVREPGTLVVTEKHIALRASGDEVRRLRRAGLDVAQQDGGLTLSEGRKLSEQLVVRTPASEPSDLDLWIEANDPESLRFD